MKKINILSDRYLVEMIDKNGHGLQVALRIYVWGNPMGKNIKPNDRGYINEFRPFKIHFVHYLYTTERNL